MPSRLPSLEAFVLCTLLAGGWALGPCTAHAQAAISAYRPTPFVGDGFVVGAADIPHPRRAVATTQLGLAEEPYLGQTRSGYPFIRRDRGPNRGVPGHVLLGVGVSERAALSAGLQFRGGTTGSGLGDFTLGTRLLLTEPLTPFAAAFDLRVNAPVAELADDEQLYLGDPSGSYDSDLLLALRRPHWVVHGRAGARFRQRARLNELRLGSEFVYGLGVQAILVHYLRAHAELYGSTNFEARGTSPMEALLGMRFHRRGWIAGLSLATRVLRGYGAARFRAVAQLGWGPGPLGSVAPGPIVPARS